MDRNTVAESNCVGICPSLPRTERGTSVVLSASPEGDKLAYYNGNIVYIRNMDSSNACYVYKMHTCRVTVAKISPDGRLCASGDVNGNVRIWEILENKHADKSTRQMFSGSIRDIAWSADNKYVAAVGAGREKFGHVFIVNTGTSCGNLAGHSRHINSVDIKPNSPLSIITGSEDSTVGVFIGPPFKFKTSIRDHNRFVNVCRFSPNGICFATGGSDCRIYLYRSEDHTKIGEFVDPGIKSNSGHSGSVFGLSWSSDSSRIATASGDKTVKIWLVDGCVLEKTVNFGDNINDQQLGIAWANNLIFTVSLNGFIYTLQDGEIKQIQSGHTKPIVRMCSSGSILYTVDTEGNINEWQGESFISNRILPNIHESKIASLGIRQNEWIISAGWDDYLRITKLNRISKSTKPEYKFQLPSQPTEIAFIEDQVPVAVACYNHIVFLENERPETVIRIAYHPTCCAAFGNYIAVGGDDSKVHIYDRQNVEAVKTLQHKGIITYVQFSPDGTKFAAADHARKVIPYNVASGFEIATKKEWGFHTGRVNCITFSPNGTHLASVGLDTNLIVWNVSMPEADPIIVKGIHPTSVNCVIWQDDNTLKTAGDDSCIRTWRINFEN